MTLIVGADHRGANAARHITERLNGQGVSCELIVPENDAPRDYPDIAYEVATRIAATDDAQGVLICGIGVGMAIAANKVAGARAAVVHDEITAELSKSHVHANILCMAADLLGERLMEKIVDVWRNAKYGEGRHERRVAKIRAIEAGHDPRGASSELETKAGATDEAAL